MSLDRDEGGEALRDLALDAYLKGNPSHQPGWRELPPFSREAWALVWEALLEAGWRPPPVRTRAAQVAEEIHRAWGGDYVI